MLFSSDYLPVKFLAAFEIQRAEGRMCTHHKNRYYAMSIRLNGSAEFCVNGSTLDVGRGEVLLIPPDLMYSQYTHGETIRAIHFEAMDYKKQETIEKLTVRDWDTYCVLFEEIVTLYADKPEGWYYLASEKLYALLLKLHEEADAEDVRADGALEAAFAYLEQHYADPDISVATTAAISGYSEAYFRRKFLGRYGVTPSDRISYLRLERAKRLLESGDHTMAEIADQIGILEQKYFSTWFRKQMGMSPSKYVNTLRG